MNESGTAQTPGAAAWFQSIRQNGPLQAAALIAALGLLFVALRGVPLPEVWEAIRRLRAWQVVLVVAIDALVYTLVTARWWFIVRAEEGSVRFLPLIGVRLAVFGISYFTVGPQLGGEPLQFLYLRRRHDTTYARAAATVVLDKLLEFLANFILLSFGLAAVAKAGILGRAATLSPVSLFVLACLLAWPALHILMLTRRHYPLSALIRALPVVRADGRFARYVSAAERLAGQFCRRHPRALAAAVLVSVLAAVGTVIEYAAITSFLMINLTFWQTLSAWTAGWLSFLFPLPGGLGALEASQVFTLGMFGMSAVAAISVTLVMRGRDALFGGFGLILAGALLGDLKSKASSSNVLIRKDRPDPSEVAVPDTNSPWEENHE